MQLLSDNNDRQHLRENTIYGMCLVPSGCSWFLPWGTLLWAGGQADYRELPEGALQHRGKDHNEERKSGCPVLLPATLGDWEQCVYMTRTTKMFATGGVPFLFDNAHQCGDIIWELWVLCISCPHIEICLSHFTFSIKKTNLRILTNNYWFIDNTFND